VVAALQAAWSAIKTTPVPDDDPAADVFRANHLRLALDAAVRAGHDTDTVAAIAGALLGAACGASAVPLQWRMLLHGWPDATAHDLVVLASAVERQGKPDKFDFSYPDSPIGTFAHHPYDEQVLLGGIGVLRELPAEVNAVVSLCRLADDDMRRDIPHVEVRLIDRSEPDENPHLDYVLLDTVRLVERLRAEGRTVLVHCVGAYSRTPTIGALYGARLRNISADAALRDIQAALPGAHPNHAFRKALRRLTSGRG
jgi:protein-tyrosine phosphatase